MSPPMTRLDQRAAAVEAMARAIAHGLGDAYESAFATKSEWNRARGDKGGRFRDINEPMQSDFNEAGKGALAALHDAGFAVVPRETTEAMREASYGRERAAGFHGDLAPRGLNHSAVWETMIAAADIAAPEAATPTE